MWTSTTAARAPPRPRFAPSRGSVHSVASQRDVMCSSRNSVSGYESDASNETWAEDVSVQSTQPPAPMWSKPNTMTSTFQKFGAVEEKIKEIKIVSIYSRLDDDNASETTLEGDEDIEVPEKTPTPWSINVPKTASIWPVSQQEEIKDIKIIPVPRDAPVTKAPADFDDIKDIKIVPVPREIQPIPLNEKPQPRPSTTATPTTQTTTTNITTSSITKPEPIKTIKCIPVPTHMPINDGLPSPQPTWASLRAAPGPLEKQLTTLLNQITAIERTNPTISITPSDLTALQTRLAALEAEKATWHSRHEALFALRDADIANLIHVRGLLAAERRAHEAMKLLREEDLANLLAVRAKLGDANRKLDRVSSSNGGTSRRNSGIINKGAGWDAVGSTSPPQQQQQQRARSVAPSIERRSTITLFEAAKTAALEQKVLELERHNQELLARQAELEDRAAGVRDLEGRLRQKEEEMMHLRESAHHWATTHEDEQQSSSESQGAQAGSAGAAVGWARFDEVVEEGLRYREVAGRKIGVLRTEKEGLQREVNDKEDEIVRLEGKVLRLEARLAKV